MDLTLELLSIQNPWWHKAGKHPAGLKFDPVIVRYEKNKLKWTPPVFKKIDLAKDKIYFLAGPKGAGKTTILKLIVRRLIEDKKIDPGQIFYYSCHNLDSYEQLNEMIKLFLNWSGRGRERSLGDTRDRRYIFIDEITMIKNWRRGIEYLRQARAFKGATVILSGSSFAGAAMKIGGLEVKLISGLSFAEFARLVNPALFKDISPANYVKRQKRLDYYLDIYLLTGGFISAINDFKENGAVGQNVYSNFLHWFLAYVSRSSRDTVLTRQIMENIILNLGRPVGFKTLSRKTKARTHLTAAEYLNLLENMFTVKTIFQADGREASRKAKKIFFQDPFVFWLFYAYVHGSLNYWQFSRERLHDGQVFNVLVENVVLSQLIKDETDKITYWRNNIKKQEISFIIEHDKKTTPVLIRFNREIKPADYEVLKNAGFKRGLIISQDKLADQGAIKVVPLTYFLLFYRELI